MTSRERILTALGHAEPDAVPVTQAYGHPDALCRRYGKPEWIGKFRQDIATVAFKNPDPPAEIIRGRYLADLPPEARIDAWGRVSVPDASGFAYRVVSPLEHTENEEELAAYPFPDLADPALHGHLEEEVRGLHASGMAVQGQMSQTLFEVTWEICGMERTFADLAVSPGFVCSVLDRVLEKRLFQARRYAEAGVDIVRVGDDVGGQTGMMISPELWRRHLKPRLKEVIDVARDARGGIRVNYHSDGNVLPIIPDLIEIGVDILNPIQPECMDPARVKHDFGERLTLLGTIGTQSTLPFGSSDEVRATVAKRIRECGVNGGFIIAPTHSIRPEVPWDNIVAFYEAVEEFGRYPLGHRSSEEPES